MHTEQLTGLNVQMSPRSNVSTLSRCHIPSFPLSQSESHLPLFQPSNLPVKTFVPQIANVENLPITHNSPRKLALKSQESCLFLDKKNSNIFTQKSSILNRPSSLVHRRCSTFNFQPKRSGANFVRHNLQPVAIVPRKRKFKNNSITNAQIPLFCRLFPANRPPRARKRPN
jgi:hypothetical protein